MKSRLIGILFKKELRDVFRDRKAVAMLILVPLLLYPLIFFGAFAVMTMVQSSLEQGEYKVVIDCEDDGALLSKVEEYNKKFSKKTETASSSSASSNRQMLIKDASDYSDIAKALQKEEIDLYVYTEEKDGKLTYSFPAHSITQISIPVQ